LRDVMDLEAVKGILARAIHSKPAHHHLGEALSPPQDRTMAQIGG